MNILYLSALGPRLSSGLAWSVPAGVRAQARLDDVLWVNLSPYSFPHWEAVEAHHNIKEFGSKLRLEALPARFQKPDLVVFEGLYVPRMELFSLTLRRRKIPYLVIPRGSLNRTALHNHAWLKKSIAHLCFYNSYLRHAAAIQYLTRREYEESGERWNTHHFILPNGVDLPVRAKECFFQDGLQAVAIGRLDPYHKGLDILLDAVCALQEELRAARFHLTLYAPQKGPYVAQTTRLKADIEKKGISDLVSLPGETTGAAKEDALLRSDLFLLTSRFEGHPMGLIEAMAYGLPVLVTPGTNMGSEVAEANAGWTCEPTAESLATALRQAIHETTLYTQKGQNARRLAARYRWDEIARRFHEESERVIGEIR